MSNLILYSDQVSAENEEVHKHMFSVVGKRNPKIIYVPSCGDKDRKYYNEQKLFYKSLGIDQVVFFDIDDEYDESKINEIEKADIIHLSAGDPVYFLMNIKRRQFANTLREFLKNGGTIVGVSGGAVLLGKSIALFNIYTEGLVKTLEKLQEYSSLGFTKFEFLPHFNRWGTEFKRDILDYTKEIDTTVLACNDGDGILISNGKTEYIGNVSIIKNGSILNI